MALLILFAVIFLTQATQQRIIQIGPGFWNVRASLVLNGMDVGTQMSFIQLNNGRFLVVDTVDVKSDTDFKTEIDLFTKNGTLMEAVIATHPFHTLCSLFFTFFFLFLSPSSYSYSFFFYLPLLFFIHKNYKFVYFFFFLILLAIFLIGMLNIPTSQCMEHQDI